MKDKILGTLYGQAIGDALGMPSELWNRNKIKDFFGKITTFLDGPYENKVARNFTKGQFTDDTAQSLLIIDALNKNHFEPSKKIIADELIEWANATNAFKNNILGPSSKAALTAIIQGEDSQFYTKNALTNGSAMRIAPIGTLFSKDQKVELVNYVKEISEVTHTSDVAIAGASMIAYAVTLAAEDKNWKEIIEGVLEIHDIAIKEGEQTFSASIAERLKLAVQFANHFESEEEYSLWLYDVIGCGTSLTESVPTALAIAYFCKDPNKCAIFCANIGGDTDTIGAMATAISGAKYGYSNFKKLWIETIDKHNSVNLEQYATTLEKNKML
ncbi:TPA: ADP-ribosylglycohydrolase family protein [Staphylococcus aureus]|nr:ADP-ribosylglycohydrolase family protein [Staphylococcus aureus]HDE6379467.1 ADP-ribosylglycohydrolase family protein [Staphylococcus aureus]HDE7859981.1 ADP-ribosylglycohydrolase family protein [Staphylococcus aureus]HDF6517487.1 ADP-ribosylglycohydrolase family protein [Staphylococcus aureus]HDF7591981.1 ADP-ribosylglycohydrolase family protein [Staphylococcus aureus]